MNWRKKRESVLASVESIERQRLISDIRKAEQEWRLAEWKFDHALGDDYVDYAIYNLEAAEQKLSMLLKQAKWQWSHPDLGKKGEGAG